MVRFKHRYLLCTLVFPTCDSLSHLPRLDLAPPSGESNLDDTPPRSSPPPPPTVTESALIHLLRESLSVNFGDVGAGEVGGTFSIKYLSPTTQTLILRVSREHYRTLWAALTLLRRVGGREVVVRVVHVSGTIRKVQHAAIALDRREILLSHRRQRLSSLNSAKRKSAIASQPEVKEKRTVQEGGGFAIDEVLESQLEKSEQAIMAIEA
ncbi:hypothetical protein JCM10212_006245 [Sporobolomyces blumeae]